MDLSVGIFVAPLGLGERWADKVVDVQREYYGGRDESFFNHFMYAGSVSMGRSIHVRKNFKMNGDSVRHRLKSILLSPDVEFLPERASTTTPLFFYGGQGKMVDSTHDLLAAISRRNLEEYQTVLNHYLKKGEPFPTPRAGTELWPVQTFTYLEDKGEDVTSIVHPYVDSDRDLLLKYGLSNALEPPLDITHYIILVVAGYEIFKNEAQAQRYRWVDLEPSPFYRGKRRRREDYETFEMDIPPLVWVPFTKSLGSQRENFPMLSDEEYRSLMQRYAFLWNYNSSVDKKHLITGTVDNIEDLRYILAKGYVPKGTWMPPPPYSIIAPMEAQGIAGIPGLFFLVHSPALKWYIPKTEEHNKVMVEEVMRGDRNRDWRQMFTELGSWAWSGLGKYIDDLALDVERLVKESSTSMIRLREPFQDRLMPFPSLDIPLDIPDEELRQELTEIMESLERKEESLKRKQDSLERREETVERKERKVEKDREKLEENEDMWMNVLRDLGVDPDALLEFPEGEFPLPDEPLDPREVLSRIPPPILEKMRKRGSLADRVAKLSLEEADKSKFFVF
jgi:hypothetical protein